jgi:hypothetical protein
MMQDVAMAETPTTTLTWKVIRFAIITFWVLMALLAVRLLGGTITDDVDREDSSAVVEQMNS